MTTTDTAAAFRDRLQAQVPCGYQRPLCPFCHRVLGFAHLNPGGSQYACLPCELGTEHPAVAKIERRPARETIGASEASWIIRHGYTTPQSRAMNREVKP